MSNGGFSIRRNKEAKIERAGPSTRIQAAIHVIYNCDLEFMHFVSAFQSYSAVIHLGVVPFTLTSVLRFLPSHSFQFDRKEIR